MRAISYSGERPVITSRERVGVTVFVIFLVLCDLNFDYWSIAVMFFGIALGFVYKDELSVRSANAVGVIGAAISLFVLFYLAAHGVDGKSSFAVIKDILFVAKIFLLLLFSVALLKLVSLQLLVRVTIIYGAFVALAYLALLPVYFNLGLLDLSSVDRFGKTAPHLSYAIPIAIGFMILGLGRFSWARLLIMVIAVAISLERRLWLVLLCAFLIYFLVRSPSKALIFTFLGAVVFLVISFVPVGVAENYTLSGVLNEVYSTDFEDRTAINRKWRAYELFMGVAALKAAGLYGWFLGFGPGYLLDLGLTIQLGSREFSDIPIFHNGYLFLFLKFGGVGFFLFVLSVLFLGWRSLENDHYASLRKFLALSLLGVTFVAAGIFGHADANVFLLFLFSAWLSPGGLRVVGGKSAR